MRKENLKRKGDDAENGSDSEEQEKSPAAGEKEEDAEMQSTNENTEENGDSKEPGTDDDFEDAETGDDKDAKKGDSEKDKESGNGEEKGDGDEEDVPLKKNGRGKPKPGKKAAKETNGDSKTNGDDKGDAEGEEEEEQKEAVDGDVGENAKEDDAGEDMDEADADGEPGSKKAKKDKQAAAKKKEVKKTKPKPAKKANKEEGEEDGEEDEEEEYEVQDIVDHRKERGGKMVFRIRWKNYGAKDDTWEPEATLSCPEIIKRYKAKLKKAEEKEQEEEYEVQDIVDHRKERGKMVYRIRWKNFKAKDDTWEPESTLSCPEIIKRYKAKLKKEEEEEDEDEEEQEYEVQEIIDHRKERGGKMVYRIRWKNFGAKDDTWEPEATLSCPDIIKRYKAKLKKQEEEEEDDEEEEYEVQEIIDHRKERGGKMVYRIRWKNFGAKDDTWEPESTLSCPDIIKRYKAKIEKEEDAPPAKKGRPGPKSTPTKKGSFDRRDKSKVPPKKRVTREESEESEDDDDVEYEVERIIEAQYKRNGQREYLVRWKGFSAKDDTWEPEDNLHCKDLIAAFNEKHKSKKAPAKALRADRKQPERLNIVERGHKTSKRNAGKAPVNYYDGE